jgi:pimeloyl-ACP methyl ester carboxylesterase
MHPQRTLAPENVAAEELIEVDGARAPALRLWLREWTSLLDFAATCVAMPVIDHWPRGDGHPVIILPGFMSGGGSTALLRRILRTLGYRAYDWGLGFNRGIRPGHAESLTARLRDVARRNDSTVSLIGWSAGGLYARELARRNPQVVRDVITLGSPFRGDPRATRAYRMWSLMNRNPHSREFGTEAATRLRAQPLPVPTTCVYSKFDGIVPWQFCTGVPDARTENLEVRCTHLSYGHNLETLYIIADRLAQREGAWRPYRG